MLYCQEGLRKLVFFAASHSQRGQPEELVSLVGSGECSQIGQGQYIGAFMGFQLKLPKAVIMIGMVPKSSSPSFSKNKNTIRN